MDLGSFFQPWVRVRSTSNRKNARDNIQHNSQVAHATANSNSRTPLLYFNFYLQFYCTNPNCASQIITQQSPNLSYAAQITSSVKRCVMSNLVKRCANHISNPPFRQFVHFDEHILLKRRQNSFCSWHNNAFIPWLYLFLDYGVFLMLVPFLYPMKCTRTHTLVVALRVPIPKLY